MTRITSTQGQLSKEEIEFILETIALACKMLLALQAILKGGMKAAPTIAKK